MRRWWRRLMFWRKQTPAAEINAQRLDELYREVRFAYYADPKTVGECAQRCVDKWYHR